MALGVRVQESPKRIRAAGQLESGSHALIRTPLLKFRILVNRPRTVAARHSRMRYSRRVFDGVGVLVEGIECW